MRKIIKFGEDVDGYSIQARMNAITHKNPVSKADTGFISPYMVGFLAV